MADLNSAGQEPADDPPFNLDDLIQVAHLTGLSFDNNPRNAEYAQRWPALLRAIKLALRLSPGGRCSVRPEYSFWPWEPADPDAAINVVAAQADDENLDDEALLEQLQADVSFVSNTSTLRLGNIRFRTTDFAIFYTHLRNVPIVNPTPYISLIEYPLVLVELKKNASRQPDQETRSLGLLTLLAQAKRQLGEQAGYMFMNHQFKLQPFIIGIAMAAEAWSYAEFHEDDMPDDFEQTEVWQLPVLAWSPMVHWGTPVSDQYCDHVVGRMRQLLLECGIDQVLGSHA